MICLAAQGVATEFSSVVGGVNIVFAEKNSTAVTNGGVRGTTPAVATKTNIFEGAVAQINQPATGN